MINRETKTSIFFQLSFIVALPWQPDRRKCVEYEQALLDAGLEFTNTNLVGNKYMLRREQPGNLQLQLDVPGPQLCGIQITAPNPSGDLEIFIQESQAALDAFQKVWPAQQYQVVRSMAKIQHLYSCLSHAFQYLWEERLGQSPKDFSSLGNKPVAGGGLRLVIPPHELPDQEPQSIELRFESYFRETNKIFVETAFIWPKPSVIGPEEHFSSSGRMRIVENYAANEVIEFLTQKKS